MWTYRAEFLQNMGQFAGAGLNGAGLTDDLTYQGTAIDLGAGYNGPSTPNGTFGLWGNFISASGDDDVTDNKDKSFHDFSVMGVRSSDRLFGEIFGKSDVMGGATLTPRGRGVNSSDVTGVVAPAYAATQGPGLQVINIGGLYKPTFVEKMWARLDYYTFKRDKSSIKTAAGTNVNIGSKYGNELDLTLGYDHSDNVKFEAGYAQLTPDEALTGVGATNKETVTKLFARANVKWGGEEK
jgi:hypothetical protein